MNFIIFFVFFTFSLFVTTDAISKLSVDLLDSNFIQTRKPGHLENADLILNYNQKKSDIILITDKHIKELPKLRKRYKVLIGWLIEPKTIIENLTQCYRTAESYLNYFDYVLTFDKLLLEKYPDKCIFFPALGAQFIENRGIEDKSKLCSFITSNKLYCEGHSFRHQCLEIYKKHFSDFKDGSRWVPYKDPWLTNFCFSVVIENNQEQDYYFSEKIIECFEKGVVPIYWGPKGVEQFFSDKGIIRFESLSELNTILSSLTFEDYFARISFIKENYQKSLYFSPSNFLNILYDVLSKKLKLEN